MLDIQWSGKHKRESGFYHIFGHFKRFYLPVIFPTWDPQDHLYKQEPGIYSSCFLVVVKNMFQTTFTF